MISLGRGIMRDKHGAYHIGDWRIYYDYNRQIGAPPEAYDVSLTLHNDKLHIHETIQLWIDVKEKTVKLTAGEWHTDFVNKEVLDLIVGLLGLEKYTLLNSN